MEAAGVLLRRGHLLEHDAWGALGDGALVAVCVPGVVEEDAGRRRVHRLELHRLLLVEVEEQWLGRGDRRLEAHGVMAEHDRRPVGVARELGPHESNCSALMMPLSPPLPILSYVSRPRTGS